MESCFTNAMRDFFVDHSQIHWRAAKGTFRHAVMEDTACSGSCCSASWRKHTHFSFVQCPNSSGVSSRQLLFKVKICHRAVTQCTHASKIAWSFAPSHILGRGPCATTRHAPLQGRNRTWRLAQRPISLGMYLSLLLWHASVLSWVSSPISGGKSDRLRTFLCVSRGMLSARLFAERDFRARAQVRGGSRLTRVTQQGRVTHLLSCRYRTERSVSSPICSGTTCARSGHAL